MQPSGAYRYRRLHKTCTVSEPAISPNSNTLPVHCPVRRSCCCLWQRSVDLAAVPSISFYSERLRVTPASSSISAVNTAMKAMSLETAAKLAPLNITDLSALMA